MYATLLEPTRIIDGAVVTDVYYVLDCRAPIFNKYFGAVRATDRRPSASCQGKGARKVAFGRAEMKRINYLLVHLS